MEFKNNLKYMREYKNITQEELANLCEVRRETILRCESGVNVPSVYLAAKIAYYLHCSVDDIFYFTK